MAINRRALLTGSAAIASSLTIRRARALSAPIRIGFVTELSGPAAPVGTPIRIGGEAARDWINAHGGVLGRPIELRILDTASNPNQGIAAFRELASSGTKLVVGPSITAAVAAVAGVVNELKTVAITTASPDEPLSL